MQFKMVGDIIPKFMITPTDYTFVADKLYSIGTNLPSGELCDILNSINNQGITDVNIAHRTYTVNGVTLSLTCLATSEILFLLTAIADKVGFPIIVYKFTDQLSYRVLRIYLDRYKRSNYITILAESESDAAYMLGRELCLV